MCFINRNSMVSDIIKNIAVVGAGSFIGGAARYLVSLLMKGVSDGEVADLLGLE